GRKDEKAPDILKLDINAWGESWGIIHAMPHEFKTGSTGFYGTGRRMPRKSPPRRMTGNPRARYQACVNITLIGSKPRG
ncbi:MAG: hypothetical protein LBQ44_08570, partial [Treponema sp.]|nr:hypothetical protein [Treponema sp.]